MISVVIPVYRSAQALIDLCHRLTAALRENAGDFEIILVEDCGGDNSWQAIKDIVAVDPRVRGFRLSRNFGQHNALLCGIRAARGDVIITMDDDLQHPPEEIHKLTEKLMEGYDVVYGPPERAQHGFVRGLASRVTKIALQGAMGAKTARCVSAFRAFRTVLRDAFADYHSPSVNIDVLLTWATNRFSAVPVSHEQRKFGKSGYTPGKLFRHALNMITGYSIRPLQIASVLGFVFALFGVLVLFYVLIRYLTEDGGVPGFPFLASIISIFSGAQLLALGIIGEYLARLHFRSMERPPYAVRERTDPRSEG